jgi:hypothetical protein
MHTYTYIHIPFPNGQPYYNIFFGICQELFYISHGKYFIPTIPSGNGYSYWEWLFPSGISIPEITAHTPIKICGLSMVP